MHQIYHLFLFPVLKCQSGRKKQLFVYGISSPPPVTGQSIYSAAFCSALLSPFIFCIYSVRTHHSMCVEVTQLMEGSCPFPPCGSQECSSGARLSSRRLHPLSHGNSSSFSFLVGLHSFLFRDICPPLPSAHRSLVYWPA